MIEQTMIASFMPHGMCYLWKPWLVGLHLVSNGVIALSYVSISILLVYILNKREDIPFNGIFLLFAGFILFCGTGHAVDVWTIWHPNYWTSGWIRLLTALVSLATAIALTLKIPQILTLPSPSQVKEINQQLQEKISQLEQQEAFIRQQEQFLRSIYDNVQEAIFVVDMAADGTFRYQGFNLAAEKLTGVTEVENKTPSQILPPELATAVENRYRDCLTLQQTLTYEECLSFQGEDTWWLTTLNPIEDATGKIYRIIGTSLNINERKRAETELDKDRNFLKTLLDNLSDGIVSCDRHGVLTLFNQATRKFHGLPPQAIPTEQWAEYYDLYLSDGKTRMSQQDIPLFRALKGESVRDVEMMIIPKQGKSRILLANGDPIIDSQGKKIGAIVAMRDISDRKQAEQALAQLNQELEARVQQRTLELEQRNQELDQFAYIVSHDLKAPLRGISNLSEWIEEDLADKLDADTRHNMNLLRSRVHRLESFINGLLAYSRVGRLTYEPETVNVTQLLRDTIDLLEVPDDFQIQIQIQGEMPTLVTELIPLQQVFNNLISNAIKYSDCHNGKIIISVVEKDDYYEFAVTDNGKGIDPKDYDKIFKIFQTLEPSETQASTGIGLAIVKKAVENQGGVIKVESQAGQGTTFRFNWNK